MKHLLTFLTLIMIQGGVLGSVTVELLMLSFHNPTGQLANELNCDGVCDPVFKFCVDHSDGNSSPDCCLHVKHRSDVYTGAGNDVIFGDTINGDIANPIVLDTYNMLEPSAMFKVGIWEFYPSALWQIVDKMYTQLVITPAPDQGSANWINRTLEGARVQNPTVLAYALRAYCRPSYYGSDCTLFCENKDDSSGHYTCDPETGDKVCLPGWTDVTSNCTVPVKACDSGPCFNNAWCVELNPGYACHCVCGTTGTHCETDIDECLIFPCENGATCEDELNGYTCVCLPGYTGEKCDAVVP